MARARFCEIDGGARGHAIWILVQVLCCSGCLRRSSGSAVKGVGVQSLARISLFGVYAGVFFSKLPSFSKLMLAMRSSDASDLEHINYKARQWEQVMLAMRAADASAVDYLVCAFMRGSGKCFRCGAFSKQASFFNRRCGQVMLALNIIPA